jgi:hypothetical protein
MQLEFWTIVQTFSHVLNFNWTLICNPYPQNETSNVSPKQVTCEQDIAKLSHTRIMRSYYLSGKLSLRDIFLL